MGVRRSGAGRRRDRSGREAAWPAVLRVVLCAAAVAVVAVAVLVAPGSGPARAAGGSEWRWPLAGSPAVVRGFAPPADRYGAGHRGVDLAAAPGAVVTAAGPGRVSYAGLLAGRGVVVVQHGALRTTYEPVTAQVVVDQPVSLGEPIGVLEVGHPGCAAAACLHWGLRRGEVYLDPLSLVGAGPVRLLPRLDASGAVAGRPVGAARRAVPAEPSDAPPDAPGFDLRSAATPSGGLALLALLAGLALLGGRRPPRGQPPAAQPAVPPRGDPPEALPVVHEPGEPGPGVVRLADERARRRPA